jgi:U3 small nucleolar RNA-associated protein 14
VGVKVDKRGEFRGSANRTLGALRKKSQPEFTSHPHPSSNYNNTKMPPRIARSSVGSSAKSAKGRPNDRNTKKSQKRAINALSIANYENPESVKLSRNRAGEIDPAFNRKRARDDDEEGEEDEDEEEGSKRRKRTGGNESFDEGSDSEGNTWQMGHVDDDDDEDIDSDEAFGESDEELGRFEDYSTKPRSMNYM